MSEGGDKRKRRLWQLGFVLFVAALFIVPEVRRMMRPPTEVSTPRLDCYAQAVVLRQQLHEAYGADPAVAFDDWADFDARFEEMVDWTRGLRRRDDPRAHALRPIIARAEEARDVAVARDASLYLADAWDRVRGCHGRLWRGEGGE